MLSSCSCVKSVVTVNFEKVPMSKCVHITCINGFTITVHMYFGFIIPSWRLVVHIPFRRLIFATSASPAPEKERTFCMF